MSSLVLSLFPGIGLLDMAFELEGFCVVRGPDLLWGGDVRSFHPPAGRFDGVIGGPPCQFASIMKRLNPRCGEKHGNLIPEFERIVFEAQPDWFTMENVAGAPIPVVDGYLVHAQLIRDVWVGGESSRLRRFSFGTRDGRRLAVETMALHQQETQHAAYAQGNGRPVPVRMNAGGKMKKSAVLNETVNRSEYWNHMLRAQGLPADFLSEAPFTQAGKQKAVGNGVPLPMGRAIARAVRRAVEDRAA
jgi:DNA (cytosine-5)-methyltransferase 1